MLISISDRSEIASSRRAAEDVAHELALDDARLGRVALVATEMATNILKHAGNGHLVVSRFDDGSGSGVELMGMDSGPGIADIDRALQDGYSTAGSPGSGLGAIRRQTDIFDIFSRPGAGTVVIGRILDGTTAKKRKDYELGIVAIPYPGETESGDSWSFGMRGDAPTLLVVDGSGHGPQAAVAAGHAVGAFANGMQLGILPLMETIHRSLASTRGAAIAVASVEMAERLVRFAGIGNISAALVAPGTAKRMVSNNGIAGHAAPRIRDFTYPFAGSPTVILHSDGISSRWDLDAYPGLAAAHPSVIAGVLSRDFRRNNDDALIVVMRVAA